MPERQAPVAHVRESVRKMIARTSRYAVFYHAYASLYRAGVRALVSAATAADCAVAVFSRNSYAAGTFIPGRSDVDLLIVIRDDLSQAMIRSYLGEMRIQCQRLRRFFPMLDQCPVYTRGSFIEACRLGPLRIRTEAWRCEWGDADLLTAVNESPVRDPLETGIRSVHMYVNGFHKSMRASLRAGHGRPTLAMERWASKINRAVGNPEPEDSIAQETITELVTYVLATITSAVNQLPAEASSHGQLTMPTKDQRSENVVIDPSPLPHGIVCIVSPHSGTTTYVLDMPVTTQAVDAALTMAHAHLFESGRVLFVTNRVYAVFLTHVNPALYCGLTDKRSIRGEDVIARIQAPTKTGVRRFFRYEAARMLEFSPGLATGPSTPAKLLQYETRRARLFHFLRCQEMVPDRHLPSSAFSRVRNSRDILGLMLDDIPQLLGELKDPSSSLFQDDADVLKRP